MEFVLCILWGYIIGSFNPSILFSKQKSIDLRRNGTGNPGATNALMIMGKKTGITVMIIDITKAVFAVKTAQLIFPIVKSAALICGTAAVLGHIFPFYLKFKGGKGVAAFGGMILAFDPKLFLFLLITGFIIMMIVNSGVVLTLYSVIMFPLLITVFYESDHIIPSLIASTIVAYKHIPNIRDAISGKDIKVRDFIKKYIFSK